LQDFTDDVDYETQVYYFPMIYFEKNQGE